MKVKLQVDLRKLIERGDFRTLKMLLEDQDANVVYEMIEELQTSEKAIVFRLLHKELAAEVFSKLEPDEQIELIRMLTDDEIKSLFKNMDPADRADLLDELPADVVTKLLSFLPKSEREQTIEVLNYPENSAGRLMSPYFVYVTKTMTVEEALTKVRKFGKDAETIYTIFVVEEDRTLLGTLQLEDLIFSDPDTPIEEIYSPDPVYVKTTTDQEEVATIMKKYDLNAIAVVDNDLRLVGIVTVDDIVDIIDEEATEDIHKMAGMSAIQTSYFHTPILVFIKNRLPWLIGLLLLQSVSAFIIHKFESVLAAIPIIAAFMTTMVDAGGNAGSQSSTLIIRSMTLGDVDLKDWFKVFVRELIIGLIIGGVLGVVLFVRGLLISNNLLVNLSAGISILLVIIFANVIGAMLPFLGRLMRIDPAVMAGPLITTIADLGGILIYFLTVSAIVNIK
ncbi:MAG: magnesium transporter [Fervidobacterium sp.]|uniref:Magnesium transporter MgtE n=1 Tax=Fervidobacterium gondwanense DSM 13020 TaxID=1121883 RepID=A0A1M7RUH3_FERGO|nr:magnesium transporter [Fervidobacterium gondwanense]UXF01911.1 magnesium transporter [Fervidobacterium riparium]SHN49925.1 magnesium transporter [Fervidobacterium gondwanense DSM 13020]